MIGLFREGHEGARHFFHRRGNRRKLKRGILIMIGFAAAVLLVSQIHIKDAQQTAKASSPSPSPAKKIEASALAENPDKKDPLLTLVNFENPLPDDWEVDLVQLKNGQSIDRRAYQDLQKMMDDAKAEGLEPVNIKWVLL